MVKFSPSTYYMPATNCALHSCARGLNNSHWRTAVISWNIGFYSLFHQRTVHKFNKTCICKTLK